MSVRTWVDALGQHPLFALGFRPFFLLGALSGIWTLLRWMATLRGDWLWSGDLSVTQWHSHEMLFGFALAIVLGFVLTAAQNWTGQASLSGTDLLLVVGLWLAARLAMNWATMAALGLATACHVLMMALVIRRLMAMLRASNNRRNFLFVPILAVFAFLNLYMAYALFIQDAELGRRVGVATLWAFVFLISLLGGRVIPFFTQRRLQVTFSAEPVWLTGVTQAALVLLMLHALWGANLPAWPLFALALITQLLRCVRWYHSKLWGEPMLWALWLSYGFLPLALALGTLYGHASSVVHLLGVGVLSGVVLAMVARISLGHTGRPIQAMKVITVAFVLVLVAALLRGLLVQFWPGLSSSLWAWSTVLWVLSYSIFLLKYWPILWCPRADGKPG